MSSHITNSLARENVLESQNMPVTLVWGPKTLAENLNLHVNNSFGGKVIQNYSVWEHYPSLPSGSHMPGIHTGTQ